MRSSSRFCPGTLTCTSYSRNGPCQGGSSSVSSRYGLPPTYPFGGDPVWDRTNCSTAEADAGTAGLREHQGNATGATAGAGVASTAASTPSTTSGATHG